MIQPKKLPVGIGMIVCALVGAGPAFGACVVNDQSREVSISANGITLLLGAMSFTPISFNHTQTADPFAPFNQSFSDTITSNSPGESATASAQQTSTLTSSGTGLHLIGSGMASYDSGFNDVAQAQSSYLVVFTVDMPTPYTLTESTGMQMGRGTSANFIDFRSLGAVLVPGVQPLTFVPSSQSLVPSVGDQTFLGQTQATFTGTLAPGTYTFDGGLFGTNYLAGANATFSVDFAVGSDTASVPLPKAAWMGLTTLGLMAVAFPILGSCRREQH